EVVWQLMARFPNGMDLFVRQVMRRLEGGEFAFRRLESFASNDLDGARIRVVFHLPRHEAADQVAAIKKRFQNQARKPDRYLHTPHNERGSTIARFLGPFLERHIPGVAFVSHARKPTVNRTDEIT